jgi:heme/copper-type cytochrome/quinol oxidase subunit 2
LLLLGNININHSLIEFTSTLFSLLFLIVIITPALIILLDFDLIILPSFIIYSLGLQWAWQFNIVFLPVNIGFESYCDHYIISSINKSKETNINESIPNNLLKDPLINKSIINGSDSMDSINFYYAFKTNRIHIKLSMNESLMVTQYLFEISQYIILPIYSFIRLFVYSFDVIHTLGFYSWGIKIDAIPGRINLANTLRLLWKGEYRGKCFELCGQGHLSMLIITTVLLDPYIIFILANNSIKNESRNQ